MPYEKSASAVNQCGNVAVPLMDRKIAESRGMGVCAFASWCDMDAIVKAKS